MRKALKLGLAVFVMAFATILLGCSDGIGGGGGSSSELVTKYSYNLTSNENYYYVSEFHAYYQGNYVYIVHDCIFHYFLKTNSRYNNKTGAELCDIVKNRNVSPNSKINSVVEGEKQYKINHTQSDGTIKQITMNIPDGTAYESWVYK